jgi:hypothetical protein
MSIERRDLQFTCSLVLPCSDVSAFEAVCQSVVIICCAQFALVISFAALLFPSPYRDAAAVALVALVGLASAEDVAPIASGGDGAGAIIFTPVL